MTRTYWIIALLLLAASVIAPAWLYPDLPDRIPTHWNWKGEVDGYGGKWTLFLFPAMMPILLLLFYFMPALSPRHFEVDTFRSTYLYIMDLSMGLFTYMQFVMLYTVYQAVHGDHRFDIGGGFFAGIFLFFGLMGAVLGKVRKNFFIGIRVPWTLASDRVWNDTHRLAARVLVIAGALGFLLAIAGVPVWLPLVVLIGSLLIPVVYSFLHYKALERAGQLEP